MAIKEEIATIKLIVFWKFVTKPHTKPHIKMKVPIVAQAAASFIITPPF